MTRSLTGMLLLEQPRDHVVVLAGEHDLRQRVGGLSRPPARNGAVHAAARLEQHGRPAARSPASTVGAPGLAAGRRRRRRRAGALSPASRRAPPALSSAPRGGRRVRLTRRLHAIGRDEVGDDRLPEDRGALELASSRRRPRRLAGDETDRRDELARRRRTPRFGVPEQRHVARLDHLDACSFSSVPAAAELERLEAARSQPPLRQRLARPVGGALVRGRPSAADRCVDEHREQARRPATGSAPRRESWRSRPDRPAQRACAAPSNADTEADGNRDVAETDVAASRYDVDS